MVVLQMSSQDVKCNLFTLLMMYLNERSFQFQCNQILSLSIFIFLFFFPFFLLSLPLSFLFLSFFQLFDCPAVYLKSLYLSRSHEANSPKLSSRNVIFFFHILSTICLELIFMQESSFQIFFLFIWTIICPSPFMKRPPFSHWIIFVIPFSPLFLRSYLFCYYSFSV